MLPGWLTYTLLGLRATQFWTCREQSKAKLCIALVHTVLSWGPGTAPRDPITPKGFQPPRTPASEAQHSLARQQGSRVTKQKGTAAVRRNIAPYLPVPRCHCQAAPGPCMLAVRTKPPQLQLPPILCLCQHHTAHCSPQSLRAGAREAAAGGQRL